MQRLLLTAQTRHITCNLFALKRQPVNGVRNFFLLLERSRRTVLSDTKILQGRKQLIKKADFTRPFSSISSRQSVRLFDDRQRPHSES